MYDELIRVLEEHDRCMTPDANFDKLIQFVKELRNRDNPRHPDNLNAQALVDQITKTKK
jgi:hypothetical protein